MSCPALDPAFGHWLAGFVDGEGNFHITRPRTSYICLFRLCLRRDDRPILEEIRDRIGVGYIRDGAARIARSPNAKPEATWHVGGKLACYTLVQVFDRFPLRAKKARDFAIWRQAVIEWNRIGPGKGFHARPTDWSRMADLTDAMVSGREYREPGGPTYPSPAPAPERPQLVLGGVADAA